MKAAWYEQQGLARDVLVVGEMPDPIPAAGEVRIRIVASGINPGDIKKRKNAFGYGLVYPRVIPHSDGAGHVDQLGAGVSAEWTGRSVWCYGAQSYRLRLIFDGQIHSQPQAPGCFPPSVMKLIY